MSLASARLFKVLAGCGFTEGCVRKATGTTTILHVDLVDAYVPVLLVPSYELLQVALHSSHLYLEIAFILDDVDDLVQVCLQPLALLTMVVFTALEHLYSILHLFFLTEELLEGIQALLILTILVLLVLNDTLHGFLAFMIAELVRWLLFALVNVREKFYRRVAHPADIAK